ncbi:hypothetical protein MLD38_034435 [Melastoma candidum]|uniref:Uncharacterized protein n=1 Tax=Melastoma candidum TaxID=119954 RepID=A0ACB9MBT2_9MYRT|nr:hypothetical protein MLD38_034435 [Melastoma candidum]
MPPRPKYDAKVSVSSSAILGPIPPSAGEDDEFAHQHSSVSLASPGFYDNARMSGEGSPFDDDLSSREEGHIYSLAVSGELLYTGWEDPEVEGVSQGAERAQAHRYPPHAEGHIQELNNPSNYIENRCRHSALWIKHSDTVSCLSLDEEHSLLYSALWDRTIKVWRVSDSKCLESVQAHNDAVNSVVISVDDIVFSGSADGTVKVWKREHAGRRTKHTLAETLLNQDCAVTSLSIIKSCLMVYAGSSDGLVNFWEQGKDTKFIHDGVLKGHTQPLGAASCSAALPTKPYVCGGGMGPSTHAYQY